MSAGISLSELGRRSATCLAISLALAAATAGAAGADTTFGGNPNREVNPELSEEVSCAPFSCTLYWTGAGGTDVAPIPPSGGSGTVTSVTLPPMPDPGTMQAVVLTSSLQATRDPAHPNYTCCSVKETSEPFTVPPDQVTTVPLSLHVSATAAADLGTPGGTSTADGVGISVLTPEGSAPLLATEDPADLTRFWAPALAAPTSDTVTPIGERTGYELEARFTFSPAPAGTSPTPGPPAPGAPKPGAGAAAGVKLSGRTFAPGANGKTLTLGKATNPPTASTTQTLTLPTAGASAAGKAKKPIVLGVGKTTVPSGKTAPLKLTLNAKGRVALAKGHKLKAILTVVATNDQGESQTLTRSVMIQPAAKKTR